MPLLINGGGGGWRFVGGGVRSWVSELMFSTTLRPTVWFSGVLHGIRDKFTSLFWPSLEYCATKYVSSVLISCMFGRNVHHKVVPDLQEPGEQVVMNMQESWHYRPAVIITAQCLFVLGMLKRKAIVSLQVLSSSQSLLNHTSPQSPLPVVRYLGVIIKAGRSDRFPSPSSTTPLPNPLSQYSDYWDIVPHKA